MDDLRRLADRLDVGRHRDLGRRPAALDGLRDRPPGASAPTPPGRLGELGPRAARAVGRRRCRPARREAAGAGARLVDAGRSGCAAPPPAYADADARRRTAACAGGAPDGRARPGRRAGGRPARPGRRRPASGRRAGRASRSGRCCAGCGALPGDAVRRGRRAATGRAGRRRVRAAPAGRGVRSCRRVPLRAGRRGPARPRTRTPPRPRALARHRPASLARQRRATTGVRRGGRPPGWRSPRCGSPRRWRPCSTGARGGHGARSRVATPEADRRGRRHRRPGAGRRGRRRTTAEALREEWAGGSRSIAAQPCSPDGPASGDARPCAVSGSAGASAARGPEAVACGAAPWPEVRRCRAACPGPHPPEAVSGLYGDARR